jgi:hypothetical protein
VEAGPAFVTQMVIDRVQDRLDSQFRDNDALDLKALGILAVDAAAVAALVAAHQVLNGFWWIPALGLAAAGLLLTVSIWPQEFDSGPDWREFYETYGGGTAIDVSRQMLAEMLEAIEGNDALAKETVAGFGKSSIFKLGLILFVISLLGSGLVGVLR